MNNQNLSSQKGWLLLEYLLALVPTTILLLLVVLSTGAASHAVVERSLQYQKAFGRELLINILDQGMREIDYNQLPIPPRLHGQDISTTDGDFIPVQNVDSNASAITFFETIPEAKFIFKDIASQGISLACSASPLNLLKLTSILLLSTEGVTEGIVSSWEAKDRECIRIQITIPSRSMVGNQGLHSRFTGFIPLRRIYTIYRNQEGALRYLGHVGGELIENQPLTFQSEKYTLKINRENKFSIYELILDILRPDNSVKARLSLHNHLERDSFINQSLNF